MKKRSVTSSVCGPICGPVVGAITERFVSWSPQVLFTSGEQGALIKDVTNAFNSGLLFQDSARTIPVTAVGQMVQGIADQSGRGNHFTATGCTLEQDSNGYLRLALDDTGYLEIPNSSTLFKFLHDGTGASAIVTCALRSPLTAGKIYPLIATNTGNTANRGALFQVSESSPSNGLWRLLANVANGSGSAVNYAGTVYGSARGDGIGQVFGFTYASQPGADFIPYSDGDSFSQSANESAAPSSVAGTRPLRIGSSHNSNFLAGGIYSVVVIDRVLTNSERQHAVLSLRVSYGEGSHFLAVGDSHTYANAWGYTLRQHYPARLEAALRGEGQKKPSLNYGISGDSTGNVIARLATVLEQGTPDFAVIYAGINDLTGASTVAASPTPTTTAFSISAGAATKYGAGTLLTVGSVECEVASVNGSSIMLTTPLASAPAPGQAVAIRTKDNLVKIGRVFQAAGCTRLLVAGMHFWNFGDGTGDTTDVQLASNAELREQQQAAAIELGATYVDFYAWMRGLILDGTYAQGDDSAWHVATSNQHLNDTGEQILADALFYAINSGP